MISKYQTIPAEEETLRAAPKKQNGGRKVAGALLAFALAAGLVAAKAGRNRGATLQENIVPSVGGAIMSAPTSKGSSLCRHDIQKSPPTPNWPYSDYSAGSELPLVPGTRPNHGGAYLFYCPYTDEDWSRDEWDCFKDYPIERSDSRGATNAWMAVSPTETVHFHVDEKMVRDCRNVCPLFWRWDVVDGGDVFTGCIDIFPSGKQPVVPPRPASFNAIEPVARSSATMAKSDERLELNDDFRGDVTFSEGEVRIVCDEKEQCENGRVRAHDPSDQVFMDCLNTNACYDSRVHAKGALTVRCVGPPEPYTGMCADSRFTSDVSINLICDGRDACDRVIISGLGHLTLTCTTLNACGRHMNIQTSCTCTNNHCHDATNQQCTGPSSSSAQRDAVAPIASFTTRPAFTVAFSPDGNQLAVGTAARVAGEGIGGLALYDVAALRDSGGGVNPTRQIEPDSAVLSAAFHPDRVVVVEANDQPAVGAWNYDTGDEAYWGLAASGRAVAFSPTGVLAVCCEQLFAVQLFAPDGSFLRELAFDSAALGWVKPSLAWDGRGRLLALSTCEGAVIFDTELNTVDKIDGGVTWGVALSPNGIYLAVGGRNPQGNRNVVVYENGGRPGSGPYVPLDRDFPVSDFAGATAIAFKDDRTFAYGDDAGALYIANLGDTAPPSKFDTHRPGINELAYSKDGLLAVAAGPGTAGEVFLFD